MNDEANEDFKFAFVRIEDLTKCQDYLKVPIELTKATQTELKATLDPRIFDQVIAQYTLISGDLKRIKKHLLTRYNKC